MQKNTVGSFIAALRKANGLTQKDLAEKLHVSDKTVSRWECGDGDPELALIPVMAEIFNVTSDELLRGERSAACEGGALQQSPRAEKQRARILSASLSRFKSLSLVSAGLAICGLIAAMLCNMVFLKAYLGFFISAAFYLSAVITQLIFLNSAFSALPQQEPDEAPCEKSGEYKRSVLLFAEKIIILSVALLALCAPLLLAPGAYAGIDFQSFLLAGAICAVPVGFIACVAVYFINNSLFKKGFYTLNEKQHEIYMHNFKLKRNCTVLAAGVMVLSLVVHFFASGAGDYSSLANKTIFDDFASFQEYIEKDIPETDNISDMGSKSQAAPAPSQSGEAGQYYDTDGNEISKDEAMSRELVDSSGKLIGKYIWRNKSIASISFSEINGEQGAFYIISWKDLIAAQNKMQLINSVFVIIYIVEASAAFILYYLKRRVK